MFKNLTNILSTNCEVIKFNNEQFIYPIFKNGRSSIIFYAAKNNLLTIKNKELSNLKKIKIFLRSPKERFVSGVWTFFYFYHNQLLDDILLKKIENFNIIDKHFVPQYIWLFHLYKYFKGVVELRPVEELYNLIPNRDGPQLYESWRPLTQKKKEKILSIKHKRYIEVDEKIIQKYMNHSIELEKLIKEFKI